MLFLRVGAEDRVKALVLERVCLAEEGRGIGLVADADRLRARIAREVAGSWPGFTDRRRLACWLKFAIRCCPAFGTA